MAQNHEIILAIVVSKNHEVISSAVKAPNFSGQYFFINPFYSYVPSSIPPENVRKTFDFLTFPGGIEI